MDPWISFFLFFFFTIALRKPYPESLQLGSFHWFIGYAGHGREACFFKRIRIYIWRNVYGLEELEREIYWLIKRNRLFV